MTISVPTNFNHALGLFALSIALGVFPPPPHRFDTDKLED